MKNGSVGNLHKEQLRLAKVAQLPPIERIAALAPKSTITING